VHNQRKRGQKSSANNQRVKKTNTDTNETTLYAWTSDRIFGEYDAQGNLIQETVYLGNTPVGILKPEGVYRIYADQIDTPRLITDDTNRPVWQWDAKPFGDSQSNEDLDGNGIPFHYNLRFPGQYYDAETKTHYNFNRDYEPETGRYIQSDPIGLGGGNNTFLYVNASPLMYKDIEGLAVGHHYVPKAVFTKLGLPKETLDVFDKATTGGPIPGGHIYDTAHREYNKAVAEAMSKWLKDNNINPKNLTPEQAGEFLKHLSMTNDPRIVNFIKDIEKRVGVKLMKKGVGFAVKKIPVISVGLFLYETSTDGLNDAVNSLLWPLSELW